MLLLSAVSLYVLWCLLRGVVDCVCCCLLVVGVARCSLLVIFVVCCLSFVACCM